jgi:hypothetical protein
MDSLIGGENWTIDPSQITDKFYHKNASKVFFSADIKDFSMLAMYCRVHVLPS